MELLETLGIFLALGICVVLVKMGGSAASH